ncbi:MAG: uroporphyrinogen-III synthase [Flavobacteriales bacterium]|nr:uroporphyrinogen-III synthase [Flavobacteriales bacterium]
MKVKTILVSQPEPKVEGSPYYELAQKQNVKVDFFPFSYVEGIDASLVRKQKIDLKNYTALIFNSKNSVDHYFRIAEEMRFKVPDEMKYFCQTETVAYYLQKYVIYRKRKIYIGGKNFDDLVKVIKKHRTETFLMPTSDSLRPEVASTLDSLGIKWERAILYNNINSDLTPLVDKKYDVLVFFTPAGVKSWYKNFPEFKQQDIRIAAFGQSTIKEAESAGLTVDIKAPTPLIPSMTKALEEYIKVANK